jgi:hypothetical protein
VLRFFERLDPCLVGIEACGTSHHWAREITKLGHEVRLAEVARTMRCDGEPVRPGMRTTRRMSRASQPDKQNGTLSADTIRASGLVRPHQQAGHKTAPDQNAKNIESTLAMREPSTQDTRQRLRARLFVANFAEPESLASKN